MFENRKGQRAIQGRQSLLITLTEIKGISEK